MMAAADERSHLPLSEIAAPLSFSAELLPAQSSEHAPCLEPLSGHCTAGAQAGQRARGSPEEPGLDIDPEQPWRQ